MPEDYEYLRTIGHLCFQPGEHMVATSSCGHGVVVRVRDVSISRLCRRYELRGGSVGFVPVLLSAVWFGT